MKPLKKIIGNIAVFLACTFIYIYRHTFSIVLWDKCRYIPSCSAYGLEAFKRHGFLRGMYFTVKRLLRCHPYSKHPSYDPVPGNDMNFNQKI